MATQFLPPLFHDQDKRAGAQAEKNRNQKHFYGSEAWV